MCEAGLLSVPQKEIMKDLISINDPVLLDALGRREAGDTAALHRACAARRARLAQRLQALPPLPQDW